MFLWLLHRGSSRPSPCGYCRITFKVEIFRLKFKAEVKDEVFVFDTTYLILRSLFCKNHQDKFLINLLPWPRVQKYFWLFSPAVFMINEDNFTWFFRDSCSAFHSCCFHNVSLHAHDWFNFLEKRNMWVFFTHI